MAYDEDLAERVRAAMGTTTFTEIKMFGGLCFTVGGNMAVGLVGDDLMVRLTPDSRRPRMSDKSGAAGLTGSWGAAYCPLRETAGTLGFRRFLTLWARLPPRESGGAHSVQGSVTRAAGELSSHLVRSRPRVVD